MSLIILLVFVISNYLDFSISRYLLKWGAFPDGNSRVGGEDDLNVIIRMK